MARQRAGSEKSFVGFRVGDVRYAVPIGVVREIVQPLPIAELPHAPRSVVGVVDHRSEVVPIIDLRRRMGLPEWGDSKRRKWILVQVEGRTVGLVVDDVTGVLGGGADALRSAPDLGAGDDQRGILGVTQDRDGMVFVLAVERFSELVQNLGPISLTPEQRRMP